MYNDFTFYKTPVPNLGSCSETGKWDDIGMINDCKKCVQQQDYGKNFYYCDGSCISQYENDISQCSQNSLVAKNSDQCENPCTQDGFPPVCGDCSDNFDCPQGQSCVTQDINSEGMYQRNCKVCKDTPDTPNTPNKPLVPVNPIITPIDIQNNDSNPIKDLFFGSVTKTFTTISIIIIIILIIILIMLKRKS
jgi:hypothetical protein